MPLAPALRHEALCFHPLSTCRGLLLAGGILTPARAQHSINVLDVHHILGQRGFCNCIWRADTDQAADVATTHELACDGGSQQQGSSGLCPLCPCYEHVWSCMCCPRSNPIAICSWRWQRHWQADLAPGPSSKSFGNPVRTHSFKGTFPGMQMFRDLGTLSTHSPNSSVSCSLQFVPKQFVPRMNN